MLEWLAPTLWIAEPDSDHPPIDAGDKVVTSRVRLVRRLDGWNERTARLFAADCAEAVLHLTGSDERCVAAIQAARDYANGLIDHKALAAAWDAAWDAKDAAWETTRDAFKAAAWAAWAAWADKAALAAKAAASHARDAASRGWMAKDAAKVNQYELLRKYLGLEEA